MRRFRWLLFLLPASFREEHEREMLQVWRDETRGLAACDRRRVWIDALLDTLRVAPREHAAAFCRNLRLGPRRLLRTPAFTATTVLTLAMGTGATAAVFSVLNTVVLRPLPWRSPESVGIIWAAQPSGQRTWLSFTELQHLRGETTQLAGVAGMTDLRLQYSSQGTGEELQALAVSHDFFHLLGVRPVLGRGFVQEDDRPGAAPVVLVTDGFWRSRLGADRSVAGTSMRLNDTDYTVAGVLPASFELLPASSVLPDRADVFLALEPHLISRSPTVRFLHALGRLRPPATFAQAEGELQSHAVRLAAAYPDAYAGGAWTFRVRAFQEDVLEGARTALLLLFGLVLLVLLMACSNVANLLLARGEARRAELAVRTALGAGPARLAGELLAEAFVLATCGTLLGICVALAVPNVIRIVEPAALPRLHEGAILDVRFVGFAALLLLLTTALFAALPMMERTRLSPHAALTAGRSGGRSRRAARVSRWLVVVQATLATIVLLTTLSLLDGFVRLQAVDLGFTTRDVLSGRVTLSTARAQGRAVDLFEHVVETLERTPLVVDAAAISQLPLSGTSLGSTFLLGTGPADRRIDADLRGITPGYLGVMGMALLEGRDFSAQDGANSPGVLIVDEGFARRLREDGPVIGRRVRWFRQPEVELEIVGIVRAVLHRGPDQPARDTVYRPIRQYPRQSMYLVARTIGDAAAAASALRQAVSALDPVQPVADIMTMEERARRSLARTRASTLLGATLAVLALMLAAVGLYGVLSLSVARRLREFGVRIALGARPAGIRNLVLRDGLGLAATGALAGLFGGGAVVRLAGSALFQVQPPTPAIYMAAGLVILVVAGAAVWIPVRRAAAADPVVALRAES